MLLFWAVIHSLRVLVHHTKEGFAGLFGLDALLDRFQSILEVRCECLPLVHIPLSFLIYCVKSNLVLLPSNLTFAFSSIVIKVFITTLRGASTGRGAPIFLVTVANAMVPSMTSPCRFLFCPLVAIINVGVGFEQVRKSDGNATQRMKRDLNCISCTIVVDGYMVVGSKRDITFCQSPSFLIRRNSHCTR
jgi:hypothetical protein